MRYFTSSYDIFLKAADLIYNSFNLANAMLQICRIGNFMTNVSFFLKINPQLSFFLTFRVVIVATLLAINYHLYSS